MEFKELRYFLAVAEELHFGRAARRLHISQPPLTQHIKKLEADLGVQLFDRTKRSVNLTAAGAAMVDAARRLVDDVEGVRRIVMRAEAGEIGVLRAGFMSSAPFARARQIYLCLVRDLQGVSVTWHGMTTSEQIRALQEQRLDIGFLHLPAQAKGLQQQTVSRDRLVLAVHRSHRLAGRKSSSLAAFRDDGFILPPRASSPGMYDLIVSICNDAGFSPTIPHRARDMLAMISLVSIGAGVCIVPRWLSSAGFPEVAFVEISGRIPPIELAMAWNPENRSPALQRALAAVQPLLARGGHRDGEGLDA